MWPGRGRSWSHLVSDTSYGELHAFADAHGIPRGACEGDHYDVPEERYAALVAAGAQPATTRQLLVLLGRANLRLRKRKGERGLARVVAARLADGSVVDVDLVRSAQPAPEAAVFAATVVVGDGQGRYAVVWSPRRQEWSVPGGRREQGESVVACAVREVAEETGLVLSAAALEPWGYERFTPVSGDGVWPAGGGLLQLYRSSVPAAAAELASSLPDAEDARWVGAVELEELCRERFWWPLVESALGSGAASGLG